MSELTPVERFFGLTASRGPIELLGLEPGALDEARVRAALRRRLDALDRHPHARSMEADEARLALHTAAAQLLDPTVRSHIIEHVEGGELRRPIEPPDLAIGQSTNRPAGPRRDDRLREFREAAFLLVRGGGGWGRRSMHRVAALAHAYGLSPEEVRDAFHTAGAPGAPARRAPAANGRRARLERAPTDAPHARKAPSSPIPAVVGSLVGLGVILVATMLVLAPAVRPADESALPEAPTTAREPHAETPADSPEAQPAAPSLVNGANALAVLAGSIEGAQENPGDAAWRFEQAVEWIASNWVDFDAVRRDEALSGVASFLHATAAGGASRRRAVEAIGAGAARLAAEGPPSPGDLAPGAWSVGVMNALARDRELEAALQLELRGRIGAAVGQAMPEDASFHSGALAAVRAALDDFVGASGERIAQARAAELWRAWGAVIDALGTPSRAGAVRVQALLLDAVQRVLLEGPSPAADAASRVGVTIALARLEWGVAARSPAARAAGGRLLEWFDDRAIPTGDLAVVTEWLGTESGAEEVTFTMVMPRSASRETRAVYRDRYAEAWGLAVAADRDSLAASWASAAAEERERVGRDVGVAATIARAVTLSRLSEAASMRWRREADAARALVENPAAGVDGAISPPAGGGAIDEEGESPRWVIEYLEGPANESARLAALDGLDGRSVALTRVEGDVLAEIALWGSPNAVRRRAQWLVREHADDPAMVNGLLEALPRAPMTTPTADLLEEVTRRLLPGPDDPDFERAARRALVARLLALLAGEGELGAIDRLSDLLAHSYKSRAGASDEARRDEAPAPRFDGAREVDAPPTPLEATGALRAAWEREAGRYTPNPYAPRSLDEIRRRRDARLRLADGVVQAFVAEQAAIVDLMASVVAAERPDVASSAARVVEEYDDARRDARHIGQQIEAGEDATLRLWALRLGETDLSKNPSGDPS